MYINNTKIMLRLNAISVSVVYIIVESKAGNICRNTISSNTEIFHFTHE